MSSFATRHPFGGRAIKAERVCRLVLLGVRTWSPTCGEVGGFPVGVKEAGSKIAGLGESAHDATVTMSPFLNSGIVTLGAGAWHFAPRRHISRFWVKGFVSAGGGGMQRPSASFHNPPQPSPTTPPPQRPPATLDTQYRPCITVQRQTHAK